MSRAGRGGSAPEPRADNQEGLGTDGQTDRQRQLRGLTEVAVQRSAPYTRGRCSSCHKPQQSKPATEAEGAANEARSGVSFVEEQRGDSVTGKERFKDGFVTKPCIFFCFFSDCFTLLSLD